jgi:hypothetical protein
VKAGREFEDEREDLYIGPVGLFKKGDWTCTMCGNVNWERRDTCNICNNKKPGMDGLVRLTPNKTHRHFLG